MLLTEKEIIGLGASHSGYTDFGRDIAKAQLRKVVEWIERYCFKAYITDADLDAFDALKNEVK